MPVWLRLFPRLAHCALPSRGRLPQLLNTLITTTTTAGAELSPCLLPQVLSSLDSPHIVKYYDSYLHGGQLHIVQELCGGGSLHAAIRRARRPLPEDAIWRVLLHTALALHHMHSR